MTSTSMLDGGTPVAGLAAEGFVPCVGRSLIPCPACGGLHARLPFVPMAPPSGCKFAPEAQPFVAHCPAADEVLWWCAARPGVHVASKVVEAAC